MTEALNISTTNVLHPRQVVELNDTKARLEDILGAAPYIRNQLQDNGAIVVRQIGEIDRMLAQAPQPFPADQIDDAVKLEAQLRADWAVGMPTQAEMRRNAPGCVDKNMAWNRRCKNKVLQWKQLRRRLHASGISEHRQADEGDISNVEMYRPVGGAQELSLDNAQIPQTRTIHLPPAGAGPGVVMSDADALVLGKHNPELLARMGVLSNEERAMAMELVRVYSAIGESAGAGEAQVAAAQVSAAPAQSPPESGGASPLTAKEKARRAKASARMKAHNATRRAKKAA